MITIVGGANDRRVTGFASAAAAAGIDVTVMSYGAVLDGAPLPGEGLVRIDGTDGDDACEQRLRGGEDVRTSPSEVLPFAPWYDGLRQFLGRVEDLVEADRFLAPPSDIGLMFDKRRTNHRLAELAIPVAAMAQHVPASADEVLTVARDSGWPRIFVKPRFGAGGARVASVSLAQDDAVLVSPTEFTGDRIFYTKDQRPIRGLNAVRHRLDRLCADDEVVIERWYPRATLEGRAFDLRVLTIAGEPQHCVLRSSAGGVTNLNLGGRRGGLEQVRELLASSLDDVLSTCRRVALEAFPRCLHLGIDILVSADRRHHIVGEVNAFGDLLVGTTHRGRSTFEAEVVALPSWLASRSAFAA